MPSSLPAPSSLSILKHQLENFSRIDLVGNSTPLERLNRLSDFVGRDIYIKRDDVTPLALGGNKLRKLEFLAAAAIEEGADTLITAGAIQSNHVRQTAAVAAKLGLKCLALLENPIGTEAENYLHNGNRLLLDLFNTEVVMCDGLYDPMAQMAEQATLLEAQGFRPYIVPVGGSNGLGALGYVQCAIEIAEQSSAGFVDFSAIIVASGSAGTHAGLAVALRELMPTTKLIGVTVSRIADEQRPKVQTIATEVMKLLDLPGEIPEIELWDDYFAPRYGEPSQEGLAAIKLLAELEAMLLDPVYTGKTMAGLLDGLERQLIPGDGPVLFVHTGGSPALFAYL